MKTNLFKPVRICAIGFFQWRANGATDLRHHQKTPIGKKHGAKACAIALSLWRANVASRPAFYLPAAFKGHVGAMALGALARLAALQKNQSCHQAWWRIPAGAGASRLLAPPRSGIAHLDAEIAETKRDLARHGANEIDLENLRLQEEARANYTKVLAAMAAPQRSLGEMVEASGSAVSRP